MHIMRSFAAMLNFVVVFVLVLLPANSRTFAADPHEIDLTDENAAQQWAFTDKTAEIKEGELRIDGRQRLTAAFYEPAEFGDVAVTARFLVEPQPEGVLACGFIVRAADGRNYYYVHFDRNQAILVRHSTDNGWNEIRRASNLDKPAGQWHTGRVECQGTTLRVSLNGTLLYEANDAHLDRGRIGFYGSQGLVRIQDIQVEGQRLEPESKLGLPPLNYSIVCEDAGAGGYEAFPDVCRLSDGRLMVVFYAGYGHVALPNEQLPLGGRISYVTSDDDGRTWSAPQTLYDGPNDDRDPSLVQLPSGRLLCNFFTLKRSEDPAQPFVGLGTWTVTSDDLGQTWSEPVRIAENHYCSSPVRVLSSGRLILGLYGETAKSASGAVIYSDDQGETWSEVVEIDNGGVRLDAETDIIELKDGTLYAALRPLMAYATSRDQGQTWTIAKPMGFEGHCPYFLRTQDDVILLAHRLPGTSLHYSVDEAQTWSENVLVDECIGAYPSLVTLRDGSVLMVYYEEGTGSDIRAKRLSVSRSGVKVIAESMRSE